MRVRASAVLLLALGIAVSTTAGAAARRTSPPIQVDSGLVTAAAKAKALEQTPPIGPGTRVALVGDSLADSISWGFVPAARARGLDASAMVTPGCGMIRGPVVADDGSIVPWSPNCSTNLVSSMIPQMAARGADVYVWISSWDTATHLVDGVAYANNTPEGRSGLASLVRETADRIAPPGSGRHIVFLAPALAAPGERGAPSAKAVADTYALKAILTEVVRGDPSRFSLVRLNPILCPAGIEPCPATFADGATPRPADGGHFDHPGSDWFAPKLLDLLGAPA